MDKSAYQQKIEAMLGEWKARMDLWNAKAKNRGADSRLAYRRKLHDLETTRNAIALDLEKLKAANDAAWSDIRYEIDTAVINFKKTLNDLRGKYGP